MTQEHKAYYSSEIGLLEIIGTEKKIKAINFVEDGERDERFDGSNPPRVIAACLAQLDEYFRGERQEFELELDPEGTDFQKVVWWQLLTIPYGQTVSYLAIARSIGNEKAIRAVGAANGQNPISIVIPCHRVVGSNGQLTGYGGGLWRKAWLLNHEKQFSSPQMALF
jgi:methylated-DNA-[protein]-cysteine S-methyltransferase